jgi:peptide deformylase
MPEKLKTQGHREHRSALHNFLAKSTGSRILETLRANPQGIGLAATKSGIPEKSETFLVTWVQP